MALFDVATSITANQALNYLATGNPPGKLGNAHPNLAPYAVFECSDGWIILATGNDGQYQRLCRILGLPALATAPDYLTNADRIANRSALTATLSAATRQWTKADLLAACEGEGVPAGPINDMAEVFADPQIVHRNMRIDPEGVPGVRSPFVFSDAELALERPAPKLGEHDAEVRAALGVRTDQSDPRQRGSSGAVSSIFSRTGSDNTDDRKPGGRRTASFSVVTSCAPACSASASSRPISAPTSAGDRPALRPAEICAPSPRRVAKNFSGRPMPAKAMTRQALPVDSGFNGSSRPVRGGTRKGHPIGRERGLALGRADGQHQIGAAQALPRPARAADPPEGSARFQTLLANLPR